MKIKVHEFVSQWNREHCDVKFSLPKMVGTTCPNSVEVRYPEIFRSDLNSKDWNYMIAEIEKRSEETLVVTTNEKSFEKGIIQLLIASRHSNFDERRVAWTLEWLGEWLEE